MGRRVALVLRMSSLTIGVKSPGRVVISCVVMPQGLAVRVYIPKPGLMSGILQPLP
jgi:hypothetical protein